MPAERLGRDEAIGTVRLLLAEMSPEDRDLVRLKYLEGLKYEEIAAKLKVSLGKVKTDIFRGREALRKRLQLQLAEEMT